MDVSQESKEVSQEQIEDNKQKIDAVQKMYAVINSGQEEIKATVRAS
jgi:hypothetical protein